ncbi:MAG: Holliday junction resolvase RuvX [Lachnospiraceae bacterium]|nr:Holliday junction resolvase RuvX [Lachnospiraceae bacterium]
MGLDYGSKTVGVAVSDPLGITAQGIEIIRREKPTKLRKTIARIEALVQEKDVSTIVLGYPKHLNNTEGDRCAKTVEFQEMLEKRLEIPVILWDERLTTVVADRTMDELGVDNHKEYVDEIAAMLILQNYLDSLEKS